MRFRPLDFLGCATSLGLLLAPLSAQEPSRGGPGTQRTSPPTEFGTYHALIIGIDDYQHWPKLKFAEQDATDIRQILTSKYGFPEKNVVYLPGPQWTESQILRDLRSLLSDPGPSDNLLIFYAGHGQLDTLTKAGYWIPVDGQLEDPSTWIPFTTIKNLLTASGVKAKNILVITDSCYGGALTRGGPTPGKPSPSDRRYEQSLRKLAKQRSRQVIASGGYAQVPDRSYFADLLKEALRSNTRRMVDMEHLFFEAVHSNLTEVGIQRPEMARVGDTPGELGQFVLVRDDVSAPPPEPVAEPTPRVPTRGGDLSFQGEIEFWSSIKNSQNPAAFRLYLTKYPQGEFAELASLKINDLTPDREEDSADSITKGEEQPKRQETPSAPQPGAVKENPKDGLDYVWIPPGTFDMGCVSGDDECYPDEGASPHRVTITKGFWMGRTEVTVGAYEQFAKATSVSMPDAPDFNQNWGVPLCRGSYPLIL